MISNLDGEEGAIHKGGRINRRTLSDTQYELLGLNIRMQEVSANPPTDTKLHKPRRQVVYDPGQISRRSCKTTTKLGHNI